MFHLAVGKLLLVASSPAVGMETCLEVSGPMAASHAAEGPVPGLGLHPEVETALPDLQRAPSRAPLLGPFPEVPAVV